MSFYFCSRYIHTDGDEKKVEWAIFYFRSSHDHLEEFFSYFSLTSEQKCRYVQMRLVGEAYWWWKESHSFYRCWFVLQYLLCTRYAMHLLVTEFRESIDGIQKVVEAMTTKIDIYSEPQILVEPEVINKWKSEVVDEPKPSCWWAKIRARSRRASYWDFCRSSSGAYMEILSFSPAMMFSSLSLRLPDVYEPLQI